VTPLYPQKLALTSPTGGGRSVGIVRSRTKATEFSLVLLVTRHAIRGETWRRSDATWCRVNARRLPTFRRNVLPLISRQGSLNLRLNKNGSH